MQALCLLWCLFIPSAFAVTFDAIVGKYKVTSTEIPIRSILTIRKIDDLNGTIHFNVRRSPYGRLSCKGTSKIEGNLLRTEATCKNGLEYKHTLDLGEIDNPDRFSTLVYSTLYGETIRMYFDRI